MLQGNPITPELIADCALEAQRQATPIDDVRASAAYRKDMVHVLTKRTLERAVATARSGPLPFEEQRRLAVQVAF